MFILLLIVLQVDWIELLFIADHFVIDGGKFISGGDDSILVSTFGFHSSEVVSKPVVTSLNSIGSMAEGL